MTIWQAIALGTIQGLTEFIPVSSSGHLVFFQVLFGFEEPMIAFDVAVHCGTLLAVFVFFKTEIVKILFDFFSVFFTDKKNLINQTDSSKLWLCILITLIPTGILAIIFKKFIELTFSNLFYVAIAWFIIGIFLIASAKFQSGTKVLEKISYKDSLWIGLAQGIALIPGISRSGSTILTGMFLGIKKEDAARFSFLMAIPAIIGAVVLDARENISYFSENIVCVLAGFLTSFVVGYFVIKWLMKLISRGQFFIFGFYCIVMSFVAAAYVFIVR